MTITPVQKSLSFEEFIKLQLDEGGRYELIDGEVVRFIPIRRHETIAENITDILKAEAKKGQLDYFISGRIVLQTLNQAGREQGRQPDVTVVDKTLWESQPMTYAALLEPPQLVVEVVSTNWEDDYVDKLAEYSRLGIQEYWIVDYLAIASRSYLGNPKEPTIFIHELDQQGVYQAKAYRQADRLVSPTFPQLNILAQAILD
jgi:Uma2 family endonuclease